MSFDPSPKKKLGVETKTRLPERGKLVNTDEPNAVLFKHSSILTKSLTSLLRNIWSGERTKLPWGESLIGPIFKKQIYNDCGNHSVVSLLRAAKLLAI